MSHSSSHMQHSNFARHADGSHGDVDMYSGDIQDLQGDVEFGDIAEGDVDLTIGDVEAISQGAPLSTVVAAKRSKNRGAQAFTGRQAVIAASVAHNASNGSLIDSVSMPAIIPTNAVIKQEATATKLPGALVNANIKRTLTLSCYQTLLQTVKPAAGSDEVDIILDKSLFPQAGAACDMFLVPVLFLTISASVLNAVSGGRYSIQFIEGIGEAGVPIDLSIWQFERSDATKPINLTIVPYTRVKDIIKPVTGIISNDQYLAKDNRIVIRLKGLGTQEQVQVSIPGVDSMDLRSFQKNFGIKG